MTDEEFRATWAAVLAVARTAQIIPIEDVQKLIETANMAESIGPILYPSEYQRGNNNLDDQRLVARGFLEFRKAIDKVREKHST